ncbi:hypothetical protein L4D76_06375 [Photobacterium sagamiensis]|uniref:hypothetical protein n=1 Tax=Photobacterium sagamiensis TaxID=2910241 RepID=UPI003D0B7844
MIKKFSAATTVTMDNDGNQRLVPVASEYINDKYERRKTSIDDAANYMVELAETIELAAPMLLRENLSGAFYKYASDIRNGVDAKTAAKYFTNELGITTNNARPSTVTDSDIINYIISKASTFEPSEYLKCPEINKSYKEIGDALGVSDTRVFQVLKGHRSIYTQASEAASVFNDDEHDELLMEGNFESKDTYEAYIQENIKP